MWLHPRHFSCLALFCRVTNWDSSCPQRSISLRDQHASPLRFMRCGGNLRTPASHTCLSYTVENLFVSILKPSHNRKSLKLHKALGFTIMLIGLSLQPFLLVCLLLQLAFTSMILCSLASTDGLFRIPLFRRLLWRRSVVTLQR